MEPYRPRAGRAIEKDGAFRNRLDLVTFYRPTFSPEGHLDGERLDSGKACPELVASFQAPFNAGLVFAT